MGVENNPKLAAKTLGAYYRTSQSSAWQRFGGAEEAGQDALFSLNDWKYVASGACHIQ